ncbi:hypothetical protein [Actinoplanes sp. NPDC020271]|uniref:hypothetical protein n=1 Tax=Actinoplanes sp. NPDC020271 TaxID=3363896 RepID=UPI003798F3E6
MALAGGVAGLLAVAGVVWSAWPADEAEPRPREYADVTACLLTDQKGVAGAAAAPVWASMQAASERTLGQVQYLAVSGEQSVANAQTFVGTLVLGRCAVIVAAPGIADDAVRAVAGQQVQQKFVVVGGAEPTTANVSRVDPGQLTSVIESVLTTKK